MSISFFDQAPLGNITIRTNSAIGTLETVTGLSVVHLQNGTNVRSRFVLNAVLQAVTKGDAHQPLKLFTYPPGEIQFKKANLSLSQITTSTVVSTIDANFAGTLGVGTVAAGAPPLATTQINLIPGSGQTPTAFTASAVKDASNGVITAKLKTGVAADFFVIDGTTTASELYFNNVYTADPTGSGTQTWTGWITVEWELLSFDFGF